VKKYYLHDGKEQQGPFDVEELKTKNITKDTSIWHEGLAEWTIADNITELNDLFNKKTPPPFVAESKSQHQRQTPLIHQKPKLAKLEPKKKNVTGRILQLIGLIGTVFIIVLIFRELNKENSGASDNNAQSYREKIMTVSEIEQSQPAKFLIAEGNYSQNFLGTKLKVHGLIKNKATVASYKDAVVKVTYYSKTKTKLGSENYTIYDTFGPHTTVPFELKIDNYQDVSTIGWEVIDAVGIGE
jgi:hypothetical protein